jgi:hypothetical protein
VTAKTDTCSDHLTDGQHELPAGHAGSSDLHRRDLGQVKRGAGVSCAPRKTGCFAQGLSIRPNSRVGNDSDTGTCDQSTDRQETARQLGTIVAVVAVTHAEDPTTIICKMIPIETKIHAESRPPFLPEKSLPVSPGSDTPHSARTR